LGGESFRPVEKTTGNIQEKPLPTSSAEGPVKSIPSEGKATPFLDPEIKKELLKNAASYGLSELELSVIIDLYEADHAELEKFAEPVHIRKSETDPPLPRSIIIVPQGPRKGLYVLLKTHGGMKEIGLGSSNRATKALHIDTGKLKVFRDGKAEEVREGEFTANKEASGLPEFLAAGVPVEYVGPWRSRKRVKNEPKDHLPREHNVKKVGFIMDWMEGGELFEAMGQKFPSYKEGLQYAIPIAKGLKCMHEELQMAHLDLKPENVFLTKDQKPKISDFGFATKIGTRREPCGTPGCIAPEVVFSGGSDFLVSPKADIWSYGCLLAELFHGSSWYNWNGQSEGKWYKLLNANEVDKQKEILFPNRHDPSHVDYWIDACLQSDPDDRPSAGTLIGAMEKILAAS
jgi:serine/threonine protein kinase